MSEPHLSRRAWFTLLLTRFLIGVMLAIPSGFLVMFLWNTIITQAVTGANRLDFWQSLGLLVLCRILFYNGWISPGRPAQNATSKQRLPEEDRAAFLSRVRQRLSETDVRPGAWGPGGHE
jgi:membrane protein implicated in regulation of membrane protease activity